MFCLCLYSDEKNPLLQLLWHGVCILQSVQCRINYLINTVHCIILYNDDSGHFFQHTSSVLLTMWKIIFKNVKSFCVHFCCSVPTYTAETTDSTPLLVSHDPCVPQPDSPSFVSFNSVYFICLFSFNFFSDPTQESSSVANSSRWRKALLGS